MSEVERNASAGGGGHGHQGWRVGGGTEQGGGGTIIAMSAGVSQQKVQAQTSPRPAICDSLESCVVSIATMPYPLKMAEEGPGMPGPLRFALMQPVWVTRRGSQTDFSQESHRDLVMDPYEILMVHLNKYEENVLPWLF